MEYPIALDPALNLSAEAFAKAWNEDEECRAQAKARVGRPPLSGFPFDAPTIAVLGVAGSVAATLTLGTASNALYDWAKPLIDEAMNRADISKEVEVTITSLPDGTRIIVLQRAAS